MPAAAINVVSVRSSVFDYSAAIVADGVSIDDPDGATIDTAVEAIEGALFLMALTIVPLQTLTVELVDPTTPTPDNAESWDPNVQVTFENTTPGFQMVGPIDVARFTDPDTGLITISFVAGNVFSLLGLAFTGRPSGAQQ